MAFMIKNRKGRSQTGQAGSYTEGLIDQKVHVSRPTSTAAALSTSNNNLFQVLGGRVRVRGIVGQVTTIIQSQATTLKITSTAKDSAGTTVGTAVDVASTVDVNALEVGGLVFVEGDGTALVKSLAGAAFIGTNSGEWVAPQGYISMIAGAASTGALKWDLWYEPLDEGAFVIAVPLTSTGL